LADELLHLDSADSDNSTNRYTPELLGRSIACCSDRARLGQLGAFVSLCALLLGSLYRDFSKLLLLARHAHKRIERYEGILIGTSAERQEHSCACDPVNFRVHEGLALSAFDLGAVGAIGLRVI